MDHFHGLIRWSLLSLLVVVGPAWSQAISNPIPPGGVAPVWTKQYEYGGYGPGDAGSVCTSNAVVNGPTWSGKVVADGDGLDCELHVPRADGSDHVSFTFSLHEVDSFVCSASAVLTEANGGVYCACKAGVNSAGKCITPDPPVPHSCPPMGTVAPDDGNRYTWSGMGSGGAYCSQGCGFWPQAVAVGSDGVSQYSYGGGISTGQSCGSNAAAGAPNPDTGGAGSQPASNSSVQGGQPATCQAPTACSGTVNGTTVCVACGTPTTTSASQTTSTPASGPSSTSTTTTSTATNPDGSTTTTTTTHNSDGSSSQTVATGPGGSNGGGGVGLGGGTCTGADCGNSDSFGGSCSASFTCSGDAVQCAIAKEQHERDCLMFQPETSSGSWATGAQTLTTAINDGDVPTWSPSHPGKLDSTNFDWSTTINHDATLASSCPGDLSFTMAGQQVALSFGGFCANAGIVGNFFVGITAILCAFILFKGNK